MTHAVERIAAGARRVFLIQLCELLAGVVDPTVYCMKEEGRRDDSQPVPPDAPDGQKPILGRSGGAVHICFGDFD